LACRGFGAFPRSRFLGIDTDDASVARARKAAAEAGLAGRVSFEVTDAAGLQRVTRAKRWPTAVAAPTSAGPLLRRDRDNGVVTKTNERYAMSENWSRAG
jgi:hypothetical protein